MSCDYTALWFILCYRILDSGDKFTGLCMEWELVKEWELVGAGVEAGGLGHLNNSV